MPFKVERVSHLTVLLLTAHLRRCPTVVYPLPFALPSHRFRRFVPQPCRRRRANPPGVPCEGLVLSCNVDEPLSWMIDERNQVVAAMYGKAIGHRIRTARPGDFAFGCQAAGAHPEGPVEWRISDGLMPYPEALAAMEERVAAIRSGEAPELVWLLEHPPLYTAGTSARAQDLLAPRRFPVFEAGRGGQYTYHGPGQRVAYLMLDLQRRRPDLRRYIRQLEEWVIRALARFNVRGERRPDRIGIWVAKPGGQEAKIAAIGVRVRRWVTYHGVAINLEPDLEHFGGIVPCGIGGFGVTSLADLGLTTTMPELDATLIATFDEVFGPPA
jgi:lipoyl(octanoyl) transferase